MVLSGILLCACGGDEAPESAQNFDGDKQEVAKVVEAFEVASREGDIDRICNEIIAPKVKAQAERGGAKCADQRAGLREQTKRYGGDRFDIDVRSVSVSGSEATASVVFRGAGKRDQRKLALLKEGDQWGLGVSDPE